jgi:SAM-dependent methyltransferase
MKPNDLPTAAALSNIEPSKAWAELLDAACAPYRTTRGARRWDYHWARGKLNRDPMFRGLLERGDLPPDARVLDIGCGQGLLASLLQAARDLQERGRWPATWPRGATARHYTGIELMPKDVSRAEAALRSLTLAPQFVCADMCQAAFPAVDVVVILDVLHYVPHAAQDAVLTRVRDALAPRGRLLLRVGDAAASRGFAASQWVDRIVTWARGHRVPPTFGRTLVQWRSVLESLGFVVRPIPQSQGTPFANVLLVADLVSA